LLVFATGCVVYTKGG